MAPADDEMERAEAFRARQDSGFAKVPILRGSIHDVLHLARETVELLRHGDDPVAESGRRPTLPLPTRVLDKRDTLRQLVDAALDESDD